MCIRHFVKRRAYGNEVGEELVGVVEMMAKEVSMYFSESGSSVTTMEKAEKLPFHLLPASSTHGIRSSQAPLSKFDR